MDERRFDDLTRRLAAIGQGRASRRAILRAVGLGVVGAAGSAVLAVPRSAGGIAARQEIEITVAAEGAATPEPPSVQSRPHGAPSPARLAADLQYDVERIFRFVRDEVRYDPYAGVLRGPTGTLWGLAGNAADQAVLLAALLKETLVETRFVVGALDDATADRLLAASRRDEATVRADAARVMGLSNPGAAPISPPPLTAEQRAEADRLVAEGTALVEAARTQVASTVRTIEDALKSAGVNLPPAAVELPERERRQHVWLQYADGPEWIDLAPSFPDAEPGDAPAEVADTLAELPDDLFHRVTILAVAEVVAGGALARQEVLRYSARSADLAGIPLTLMHITPQMLQAVGAAVGGALEGTVQYEPYLLAGTTGEVGTRLTFGRGGGVLAAFGDGGLPEGEAVAEWLEVEVAAPDRPLRRVVREVFDRIGPERRAAGDVDATSIAPIELTDIGEGEPGYLPLMALTRILVAGHDVPGGYFAQDYAVPDAEADLALPLYGHHYARAGLAIDRLPQIGHRLFLDAPNVTAQVLAPRLGDDGSVQGEATLDLIHQALAAAPTGQAEPGSQPRLYAGILNQVAEQTLVEAGARRAAEIGQPVSVASVGKVFEAAGQQGVPIRTLLPGTGDPAPAVSPAAGTRIAEALAAGYVVVAPGRAVVIDGREVVGWWQVDPATGEAFDVLENGRGAALLGPMNEDAVPRVVIVVRNAPVYKKVGACAVAAGIGTGMALGGFGVAAAGLATGNNAVAAVFGGVATGGSGLALGALLCLS